MNAAGSRTGMFLFTAAILTAAALVFCSCKRETAPGSVDEVFVGLAAAKDYREAKNYYTGGTIAALERAAKARGVTAEQMSRILPSFGGGTEWELSEKDAKADRAVVTVRFTKHPVQNMIGFIARFSLVKEKGSWKIDLEDDVDKALPKGGEDGAAEYLRKLSDFQ